MMLLNKPSAYLLLALLITSPAILAQAENETQADSQTPKTADEDKETGKTSYLRLEPSFVTHVGEPGNKLTYLKAEITLRTASTKVLEAAEQHMPRLRHELVVLLGNQTNLDRLASTEGQEALRKDALELINGVLKEQKTEAQINDVLFTSFVVQR